MNCYGGPMAGKTHPHKKGVRHLQIPEVGPSGYVLHTYLWVRRAWFYQGERAVVL